MGSCLSTQHPYQLENSVVLKLPPETWLKIINYLGVRDLCRVAQVCKCLYNIASDHTLWSGTNVKNINKIKNVGIASLFAIPRFSQIKKLDISNLELLPEYWSSILGFLKSTTIEELALCFADLSKVSGHSLANCISNLSKVNLGGTRLSVNQLEPVLKSISESTVLKELNLDVDIMSETKEEPDLKIFANQLTKAVCNLQRATIPNRLEDCYTKETLIKFFESCLLSTKLKELSCRMNVSQVPCDIFAKVMCHLHKARFSFNKLTSDQLNALFKENLHVSLLKHLFLIGSFSSVCQLSPILLTQSISKLESISFPFCPLTTEQVTAVFNAAIKSSALKAINFALVDLSGVRNIPEATCHLQRLILQETHLSASQTIAILRASLDSKTLEEVNLWLIDLSEVPAVLLSQAMCRLRRVMFGSGGEQITLEQCNHFLTSSLSSRTLKEITLFSDNIRGVSTHLIGKAIARLERSNLEFNNMSKEQLSSILAHSVHTQTLVEVKLSHANMSTLRKVSFQNTPNDILIEAKNKFCTSNLLGQRVVRGRDWGRGRMDVRNIATGEEDGGGHGTVMETRIKFSEKGDYWSQTAKGLVGVMWDNGNYSICRMGRGEFYDIKLHPVSGTSEWFEL